jgi:pyruvate dehydrogenase E2 component (dihydrolipoamide acetyltransferase)
MAINQCQRNYKMSDTEIKVPNIGEFKDVEVIEVLVANGQSVLKNDPLITIESDKSSVEIPSSFKVK